MKTGPTVLVGVTGSIAAYKACEIVSLLKKAAIEIHVLLTKEAEQFITPLTFRTISQNPVTTDMFTIPDEWNPKHTSLAERADLVLVAPATANSIAKLAAGICDDMLTCTVLATKAPVLIAPAMHENMYYNAITQANIKKLTGAGYYFVGPVKGHLACGCDGMGHIADSKDIVSFVKRLLK